MYATLVCMLYCMQMHMDLGADTLQRDLYDETILLEWFAMFDLHIQLYSP